MHCVSRLCHKFASRPALLNVSSNHTTSQAVWSYQLSSLYQSSLYHSTPKNQYAFGHSIQPTNIVRSPLPDIETPSQDLYRHVYKDFAKFGKKIAIVDGVTGRELSYNQIDELTSKFSSSLRRMGFGKGDVLTIVSPNSPEYAILFFGALASGGVVSTCNPTYTVDELSFQFTNSNAKFVATVPFLLSTIQEACKGSNVETIIVVDEDEHRSRDGLVSYHSLIQDSGSLFDPVSVDMNDTAVLPYSSGTTGLPKGVMLTHQNVTSNIWQLHHPELFDLAKEGVSLMGVVPFFHIYGMVVIMSSSLHFGSRMITLRKFEPDIFLSAIERNRVTIGHLVPSLVLFLAKYSLVDKYDLSSLDQIMTGAAPVSGETVKTAKERVGCRLIRQGYGLTETSPVTHVMPEQLGMTKPDSIGVCVRSVSTKIVDLETGEALPAGKEGEVLISGPNIMKGYLNRPDATKGCINEEGWFSSGDIGKHYCC